jgi:hypothetical protein
MKGGDARLDPIGTDRLDTRDTPPRSPGTSRRLQLHGNERKQTERTDMMTIEALDETIVADEEAVALALLEAPEADSLDTFDVTQSPVAAKRHDDDEDEVADDEDDEVDDEDDEEEEDDDFDDDEDEDEDDEDDDEDDEFEFDDDDDDEDDDDDAFDDDDD